LVRRERYVLDHHAVIAGLAGAESEHHRREVSRLLASAIDGGPAVAVLALCVAATASVRLAVLGYLTDLIISTGPDVITIPGLERTPTLNAVRQVHPKLDRPAARAVTVAITTAAPLITTDPAGYADVPVDILEL
jgi:hypothetical protein